MVGREWEEVSRWESAGGWSVCKEKAQPEALR